MPFASPSPSPLGPPTHSAVIVAVTEAEPAVAHHRRQHDASASWGVPAHVTVLYPFMDPADLDEGVHARLARAVGAVTGFSAAFPRTDWFDEQVLWLAPEPAEPFRELTRSVAAAFPEHQPYGGVFDDVVPHLTVGMQSPHAPAESLRGVERQVRPTLPVKATVTEVQVIVGRPEVGGRWDVVARLPLG